MTFLIVSLSGLFILFCVLYAWLIEANRVMLSQIDIPGAVNGLRILHISDTHLYRKMSLARWRTLRAALKKSIASEPPDMILLTGDIIDKNDGIPMVRPLLQGVTAKLGIFAVLGNHDLHQYNFLHIFYPLFYRQEGHPADLEALRTALNAMQVRLLSSEGVDLEYKRKQISLYGIDPLEARERDLNIPGGSADYRIMLSHYPDAILRLSSKGDLMLSGHTHGGQITLLGWPLITKSHVPRSWVRGLHRIGETWLYTSRGAGVSHYIPLRFGSRPEITKITIQGNKS